MSIRCSESYDYESYKLSYRQRLNQLRRLDGDVCSRFEEYRNEFIIDIKTSLDRGAKLLDARRSEDVIKCAELCCGSPSCDLGLFRVDGESSAGHNCYLVECGSSSNCVMAYHREFISMMFKATVQSKLVIFHQFGFYIG